LVPADFALAPWLGDVAQDANEAFEVGQGPLIEAIGLLVHVAEQVEWIDGPVRALIDRMSSDQKFSRSLVCTWPSAYFTAWSIAAWW
jgi:hypothetical protein